jgi:thiosulfate dehydrogenase
MKNLLIGFVTGWILLAVAAVIFVRSGGMPVPVKSKPLPLEQTIADISLDRAMRGSGDLKSPIEATEAHLLEGAKVYKANCAFCHALPGQSEPSLAAKGMFPGPPMLFQPDQGATGDPAGTTYWVVKNGIRLTGMPGFVETLSDEKLWEVSWLLKMANELPAAVKAELERGLPSK